MVLGRRVVKKGKFAAADQSKQRLVSQNGQLH